jgi:hypothetical protein
MEALAATAVGSRIKIRRLWTFSGRLQPAENKKR